MGARLAEQRREVAGGPRAVGERGEGGRGAWCPPAQSLSRPREHGRLSGGSAKVLRRSPASTFELYLCPLWKNLWAIVSQEKAEVVTDIHTQKTPSSYT